MENRSKALFEFGGFRLDAQRRLLFQKNSSEPVELTPKVFDMLLLLVQRTDRVVEKKELMESLWPDSFVEESNLFQNISTLRRALGENPQTHQFIVTVPGRGYRFVSPVRRVSEEENGAEGIDRYGTGSDSETSKRETLTEFDPAASQNTRHVDTLSAKRVSSGSLLVVLTISVAVAISAFGIYKLRGRKSSTVSFQSVRLSKLTSTGKVVTAAISPDGRDFAYVTADSGRETLWIKQVAAASSNVEIVPAAEATYHGLSFSPDGNFIYYVRSSPGQLNTIFRVPALGGPSIILNKDVDSSVTFSPDGKLIAFLRGYPDQNETALMVAQADGTNERKLTVLKNPSGFVVTAGPAWSPDGQRIATVGKQDNTTAPFQHVLIVDVADGHINSMEAARWQQIGRLAWFADGNSIILCASDQESSGGQIWQLPYPAGRSQRITNDLADYQYLTLTRDSRQIVAIQNERQANVWITPAADQTKTVQITSGNGDGLDGVSFAPDGRLVYSVLENGKQSLWISNQDGHDARQLTSAGNLNRTPVVSPDSRYVVFGSDRSGAMHLWRLDSDGSHPLELTQGSGDAYPQITPDGQWIIYRSYKNGNPNLFRIAIDGGAPITLTDQIVGPPVISPDGKFIACPYREAALSAPKLAVISIEGGKPRQLFEVQPPITAFRWTSDGKGITYVRTTAGASNLWRQLISGGPPEQLTHFTANLIFAADWSPDGKWLVYSQGKRSRDVILLSRS